MTLSLLSMERILKEVGAERVGEDAKAALREVLEERALEIAKRAVALAKHADRTTVKAADIKLANK